MTTQTGATEPKDPRPEPESATPAGYERTEQWQAALSVMHPDVTDPDWKHYHGAWGG